MSSKFVDSSSSCVDNHWPSIKWFIASPFGVIPSFRQLTPRGRELGLLPNHWFHLYCTRRLIRERQSGFVSLLCLLLFISRGVMIWMICFNSFLKKNCLLCFYILTIRAESLSTNHHSSSPSLSEREGMAKCLDNVQRENLHRWMSIIAFEIHSCIQSVFFFL